MRSLIRQQQIRCPNCGNKAKRCYFICYQKSIFNDRIIHTECEACDYLMVMSSLDGHLIEANGMIITSQFNSQFN